MRRILATLLLLAAPVAVENDLLGTWVAVQRSLGGLGTMITFLPGGKLEMSFGAIVEGWYRVDGDKLIEPPETINGKPTVSRFRIERDSLYLRCDGCPGAETRLLRVGHAQAGAPAIVGRWRDEPPPKDAPAEEKAMSGAFREYTRDGLTKFRLPMNTEAGTYDLTKQTVTLQKPAHFRVENGVLILADGKEMKFVRSDATKDELKRAGIRYRDRPAELDPP